MIQLKDIVDRLERLEQEVYAEDEGYPEPSQIDDILDGRAHDREEEARAKKSATLDDVDQKPSVLGKIAVLTEMVGSLRAQAYYHSNENDDDLTQTRRMVETLHKQAIGQMSANRRWIEEIGRLVGVEVHREDSSA